MTSIDVRGDDGCGHSTRDATDEARKAMQVVDATCILELQPGLQEWLGRRDECCSGW